jgi:predicted enzyme related to lactoylglutathione lyase
MSACQSGDRRVKMNLENQIFPVSDVDRAKGFYEQLGWRFDDDVAPLDGLRIVQFTPLGSAASITFGTGITTAAPGSVETTPMTTQTTPLAEHPNDPARARA